MRRLLRRWTLRRHAGSASLAAKVATLHPPRIHRHRRPIDPERPGQHAKPARPVAHHHGLRLEAAAGGPGADDGRLRRALYPAVRCRARNAPPERRDREHRGDMKRRGLLTSGWSLPRTTERVQIAVPGGALPAVNHLHAEALVPGALDTCHHSARIEHRASPGVYRELSATYDIMSASRSATVGGVGDDGHMRG